MSKLTKYELINIAERGEEDEAKQAMKELKKINSSYHWCFEWDGLVICNEDKEYEVCLCLSPETELP